MSTQTTHTWRTATRLLHEARNRTPYSETSDSLFLTSGFVYDSAEQAAATFEGTIDHLQYSRYGNPTVDTLQERLALLEGAEACLATSTGMGAVSCALLSHLKAGDRIVASSALFGSTHWLLSTLLPSYGIETEMIDGRDDEAWDRALSRPTAAVLIETPSNPMLDVLDVQRIADRAHKAGAIFMVDNVFATPVGQRPLDFGADVVIYSCTKHLDGQGRVMGGAVLGSQKWVTEKLQPFARNTGNTLSPFNAWVLLKGLETLDLRARTMAHNAAVVADALATLPGIQRVIYPGRKDHPQAALVKKQMRDGGSMIAFDVVNGKKGAFACMNSFEIISISNNLGDARSLVTHPATTTHKKLTEEERAALRITDGSIRFSVGLEDPEDLISEVTRGAQAALAVGS
ncbi:aminotransferase class I/II-fold pyridoxal phosphate-dependent enzyme [Saccharibacter sp. 17.LH.SD]|uniref:aminotransferase class I/II-fold pyridoxal phosphate-dependent enzyme n=1 Tax=Saccharibacter sp. 17.LH.SD TaxID=2689393 RepID=UPI00136C3C28|nr:aminotransferase class I/II-fold pyridoxal phosphate-dependent enzyme [Saccharibacter sp. 17.LH.SD]MXV43968.1 aminotransferase class I/II-fold pyridoxal phosphate-dependent enzyme [Saccharibacter sp. 17.LH.SD]